MHQLEGHRKGITSICMTPDGKQLVSGSKDATARLWSLEEGALVKLTLVVFGVVLVVVVVFGWFSVLLSSVVFWSHSLCQDDQKLGQCLQRSPLTLCFVK